MLEGNSNSPPKTFAGVRFFLVGFDALHHHKVRSQLVDCGGVDVGHYSPKCTHVIVDQILYDDPICVAARNDAKTLVTSLWVHHSFDVGLPVDPTSVIYRPLKHFNGIPGANTLIVCLTGYQRQDREDIMTMVSLMGAHFSKPLVANKVTHLVCYKFEGEKYELAKKIPKIKLVNHRWLEDCLRDWTLLPEDDYNKSGYEMEMMEAEARDSEDEAENTSVKQSGVRSMHKSPHNMKAGSPATSGFPNSKGEVRKVSMTSANAIGNLSGVRSLYNSPHNKKAISPATSRLPKPEGQAPKVSMNFDNPMGNLSGVRSMYESPYNKKASSPVTSGLPKSEGEVLKVPMNFENAMENLSIPRNENKLAQASSFSNAYVSEAVSCQDACKFRDATDGELNDQHHRTPDPKARDDLTSKSGTAERPFNSAGKSSYSRKSTVPLHMEDKSSDRSVSSNVPIPKFNPNDDLASPTFKTDSNCVEVPCKGTHLQNGEDSTGILPRKRTLDLSYSSSKSQKMSPNAKSGITRSPSSSNEYESPNIKPSLIDGSCETTSDYIVRNDEHSPEKYGRLNAVENSSAGVSPTKSSTFIQKPLTGDLPFSATVISETGKDGNADRKTPLSTFQRLRKSSLSSNPVDCVEEKSKTAVSKTVEVQNQNQDVEGSSPNNKKSVTDNSNDPANSNLFGEGLKDLVMKPLRKKTISKKTLGSRRKLISADKKGSVDASLNDTTVHLDVQDNEKSPGAIQPAVLSPDINAEPPQEVEGKDVAENNIESMDDETEAPEEESERKLENVLHEAKAIGVQSTSKCLTTEEKSEGVRLILDHSDACVHGDAMGSVENTEGNLEKTDSDKTSMLLEPTSEGDGVKAKNNGKKRPLGKSKLKTVPSVTDVKKPKKVVCEEDTRNENSRKTDKQQGKKLAGLVGISKSLRASNTQLDNSSEMKENRPTVCGDKTVRVGKAKQQAEKSTVKSNTTLLKINHTSVEVSPNSSIAEAKAPRNVKPVLFILSGHRFQRKDFQQVIRRLKGRCCRDSHHWSYEATHFIVPDPIRRTEKFFAAAASGRWILKSDYLAASNQAGRFLAEEPYEWYQNGLTEDGAINLEAPRKWRLLRERTGHGAFHGMRIIIYGECIAPSLDTLKRVVKAGDGTILATSPPYTRFLKSGVDFAIVSPGMPRVDIWVQEFLRHEIPCVVADYLVEYVCKPGYPLERHVLHNTHALAEKSFESLQIRAEEVVEEGVAPLDNPNYGSSDIPCVVCGSGERGEVMLICGNESGTVGCGVGTHIDCCNPPLVEVPEDDWFCPRCSSQNTKNSSGSSSGGSNKKRKKGKGK